MPKTSKPKFKKIKTRAFRGKDYRIIWRPVPKHTGHAKDASGLCEDPKSDKPRIWINPTLDEKDMLRVLIDEIFHAHFFDIENEAVDEFSTAMADFLTEVGYRLSGNTGSQPSQAA